jgi:hypothetical protein
MAVTVTYQYPVAGVTAPTAVQMGSSAAPLLSKVRATVISTVDGDTTATITHNMGLSTADLAAGRPEVKLTGISAFAAVAGWFVSSFTTNTVVLTKTTTTGSGNAAAQLEVVVERPNSVTE